MSLPAGPYSISSSLRWGIKRVRERAHDASAAVLNRPSRRLQSHEDYIEMVGQPYHSYRAYDTLVKKAPPPPPPPLLRSSTGLANVSAGSSSSSTTGNFSRAGLAARLAPPIVPAPEQATNRAVFVPLAPQGRYSGLGSTTPQHFIPQLAPPKAVSDVYAESTRHTNPPQPLASGDSRALMRLTYLANDVMTGQISQASAVNASKDDSDRIFSRDQASTPFLHQNTHGGLPPRGAPSRLLVRSGGASEMMPHGGAAVCPTVVIDAAGDAMPAQDASQMSMLDCIAPRATEAAAALHLDQIQANQDREEAEAGQLESDEGLLDEEEQQSEAEVQQLAGAAGQVMEAQAAGGAPEAIEGNAGVGQAAAEQGNAAEEEGGFSATEEPAVEGPAQTAEAWAASQAAHAEAEEEREIVPEATHSLPYSSVQGQRGAPNALDGALTIQLPEAQVSEAQQQQRGHLQYVHGAVPNDVEHVLHHMEVAVTPGATDEVMQVQLREAMQKVYAQGLSLADYAFQAQQYREEGHPEHQIEAWLSECNVCVPVYRYSMTRYHNSFMRWYHEMAAHQLPPEIQQTAAMSTASEPAGVGASHAGHDCQAATEAASSDSSQVSSECALAPSAHVSATDGAVAVDDSASASQEAAAEATEGADLSADSVTEGSESAQLVSAVTWEESEPMLSDSASATQEAAADDSASVTQAAAADATEGAAPSADSVTEGSESASLVPAVPWEGSEPMLSDSASATQAAAADATEGADLSADSVIKGSESASPVPAVTWEGTEPMLSDSAPQEAACADLEETVDHALAQLIDELMTAAVAEFLALSGGASQPADPTIVAASEAAPANKRDPCSGTAVSSGSSPAAVVAVAAGTGSACPSGGAIHGSIVSSMGLLPHSDLIVSPPTAEGCNTEAAHSAEAQHAKDQAAHNHSADAQSTDAAQHADAHAHSDAVNSADAQGAVGQDAQDAGASTHTTQALPADAHSTEAVKAETADAEAHSLAGDTAQSHSAEAYSTESQGPDADMAVVCTADIRVGAVQLVKPDDSAVAADITPALSPSMPGASNTDNAAAATAQAVTTAVPDDAATSDTAETQPPSRQLPPSQPTESAPLELTQSPELTHSAAESAENSSHRAEGQPEAAVSLTRLHLQLLFMHEKEAVTEREVEQMRQRVTEVEDACKVAVEREVGYRQNQNARLQSGKQVRYGPKDLEIALAKREEAILWAQRADATTHNLEGRLKGLATAVAGLNKDKAALQQHVQSLVAVPTSCGSAAQSSSNDSSIQSLSSQQKGDSPSPRQSQPEKQLSFVERLLAKSTYHRRSATSSAAAAAGTAADTSARREDERAGTAWQIRAKRGSVANHAQQQSQPVELPNKQLTQQMQQLLSEMQEMRQQIQCLHSGKQEAQQQADHLTDAVNELRQELRAERTVSSTAQLQTQELKGELAQLSQRTEHHQHAAEELQEAVQCLIAENSVLAQQHGALTAQHASLTQQNAALLGGQSEQAHHSEQLRKENAKLAQQVQSMSTEQSELRVQLQEQLLRADRAEAESRHVQQVEVAAAEASIRDQQAQQQAQLLAAQSQEPAALMPHLAAQQAATLDKAEVMALRQELQLLRTSDTSSQQQARSEEEAESELEVAHTLLGLSEWKVEVLSGLVQREGIDVEVLFDMVRQEELACSEVNEEPLSDQPAEYLSSDAPGPAAGVPLALPSAIESVAADLLSEPSFDSWTAAESLSWGPSTVPGHAEETPQALSPCPMQTAAFSFATDISPSTDEMVPTSSLVLEDTPSIELPTELTVGRIVGEMSAPFVIPFTGSSHAEDELPLPVILPFAGANSDDFNLDKLL